MRLGEADRTTESRGYLRSYLGSLAGGILGGYLGFTSGAIIVTSIELPLRADCDLREVGTGLACIPVAVGKLILYAFILGWVGVLVMAPLGCYLALRLKGVKRAGRTAISTELFLVGVTAITIAIAYAPGIPAVVAVPILAAALLALLASPLVGRKLAIRKSHSDA